MYNANKSIFPAYSGLEDVRVELPSPPSRSSIARDVGDLWNIHNSEPHVDALQDPGLKSPLPDDGFNPSKDLSETSEQNILVNRGSSRLSQQEFQQLMSDLKIQYSHCLDKYHHYNSMTVGEIKDAIYEETPGVYFLYNSSNKKLLIQAKCLVESLEKVVEDFVENATFENDAKAKMVYFVSLTPQTKNALLLPDLKIRQDFKGNTEVNNFIDNALKVYGLTTLGNEIRENDGFDDYRDAISISKLDLSLEINIMISKGFVKSSLLSALKNAYSVIKNPEIKSVLKSVVLNTIQIAENDKIQNATSLLKVLNNLQEDLQSAGIDPLHSRKLISKVDSLQNIANEKRTLKISTPSSLSGSRTDRDLKKAIILVSRLKNKIESQIERSPNDDLPSVIKMYTFLVFEDCLRNLSKGRSTILSCSVDLYDAIKNDIEHSNLPSIKSLKKELMTQSEDLKSAQITQNQNNLERAKEENLLSSKKFQILSGLMG